MEWSDSLSEMTAAEMQQLCVFMLKHTERSRLLRHHHKLLPHLVNLNWCKATTGLYLPSLWALWHEFINRQQTSNKYEIIYIYRSHPQYEKDYRCGCCCMTLTSLKTEVRISLDDWKREAQQTLSTLSQTSAIHLLFLCRRTYFNDVQQVGWINQQQACYVIPYVLFVQLKVEVFIMSCVETTEDKTLLF